MGALLRAAHAEAGERNFADWNDLTQEEIQEKIEEVQEASRMMGRITERNGCDAASDRLSALAEAINPLAEEIVTAEASTLAGLRAKALVMLWEARPSSADHEGALESSKDDGGASRSLFDAAASLTGLAPMVREIEGRLAADKGLCGDMDI
jgi:hypothetical protein